MLRYVLQAIGMALIESRKANFTWSDFVPLSMQSQMIPSRYSKSSICPRILNFMLTPGPELSAFHCLLIYSSVFECLRRHVKKSQKQQ